MEINSEKKKLLIEALQNRCKHCYNIPTCFDVFRILCLVIFYWLFVQHSPKFLLTETATFKAIAVIVEPSEGTEDMTIYLHIILRKIKWYAALVKAVRWCVKVKVVKHQ